MDVTWKSSWLKSCVLPASVLPTTPSKAHWALLAQGSTAGRSCSAKLGVQTKTLSPDLVSVILEPSFPLAHLDTWQTRGFCFLPLWSINSWVLNQPSATTTQSLFICIAKRGAGPGLSPISVGWILSENCISVWLCCGGAALGWSEGFTHCSVGMASWFNRAQGIISVQVLQPTHFLRSRSSPHLSCLAYLPSW